LTKIPSERLRDANGDIARSFREMRAAIDNSGPLDYSTRECIMLAAFAVAGYEESFRIHAQRALKRGISKAALQQAVLIPFGATAAMLPIVRALQWLEDAFEQHTAEGASVATLRSADGTSIGYGRTGDGPPLVLVHGATSERSRWTPVLGALQRHFTVYAMDRRGRGGSGDAAAYRMEREFEDVAALIESIGGPVDVVSHSYGAICSLEATRHTRNIRRLVLYEPPISARPGTPEEAARHEAVIREIESHIERGERAAALETFFFKVLRMPEQERERLRGLPSWSARLALAHTLPRELRESRAYRFDASRFRDYMVPTLIVLGGDSEQRYKDTTALLCESLAGSKVAVLAGQGHGAIDGAPDLFAATVLDFLRKT
jgi:pimeloyl-ACP methyl ester carboxylesterase/alkylhydroperoxidase/carboxymuconolactone decarboxylase family protein YurZ